jgi:7-cyano-7-deazaguanine synthase
MREAVVLLSGGLDSSTLLHELLADGYDTVALSVFYGQRHAWELKAADAIARAADVPQVKVDLGAALRPVFADSNSSQVGGQTSVPEGHYAEDNMAITVVPNRNLLLLAVAGAFAASRGAAVIAYAAHAGDHAQYPDCRPEFISSCAKTLHLATGVVLYAPFQALTKAEIVQRGNSLRVPFGLTWSCYTEGPIHCGRCGTCVERAEAFFLAQVPDPTEYIDSDYWKTVSRAPLA